MVTGLYYERENRRHRFAVVSLGLLLIAMALGLSFSCRSNRIDSCRERGGQPVVPAWFSDEPHDVRCIEP